jgi:hypothetical protein
MGVVKPAKVKRANLLRSSPRSSTMSLLRKMKMLYDAGPAQAESISNEEI